MTIILFIATSLDGFIAGPKGEINWLFSDADYGFKKFYSQIDAVLMGRKTYQLDLKLGGFSFKEKEGFIFSKNSKFKSKHAKIESNPVRLVRSRAFKNKRSWLVGGGEIATLFAKNKLIDEVIISIHPIVLGKGIPIFKCLVNLKLKSIKSFPSGLVQIHYLVKK